MLHSRVRLSRQLRCRRQRGAALLLAMIILTLVATLSAGMMYQQDRAIRVETAERAHEQTARVARGALEMARWILRRDTVNGAATDHLGEAWATRLPETELSSLIAGNDRSPTEQPVMRAFVRGGIIDVQGRLNLYNLVNEKNELDPLQHNALRRLCSNAGLPAEMADRIAEGLLRAWSQQATQPDAAVAPVHLSQLSWLGVEPGVIKALRPWVDILPVRTPLNINTAPAMVLSAALGIDIGSAERLEQERSRSPGNKGFENTARIAEILGKEVLEKNPIALEVKSNWFEVDASLRIGDEFTRQTWLLERTQRTVVVRREERRAIDETFGS